MDFHKVVSGLGNVQVITQPATTPQLTVGQHIQQDPYDPNKWQVLQNVTPAAQPATVTTVTPTVTVVKSEQSTNAANGDANADLQKQRVRRVACTCPNCAEGKDVVLFH